MEINIAHGDPSLVREQHRKLREDRGTTKARSPQKRPNPAAWPERAIVHRIWLRMVSGWSPFLSCQEQKMYRINGPKLLATLAGACSGPGNGRGSSSGRFDPLKRLGRAAPSRSWQTFACLEPRLPRPQSPRQGTPLPPPSERGMPLGNNRVITRGLFCRVHEGGDGTSRSLVADAP